MKHAIYLNLMIFASIIAGCGGSDGNNGTQIVADAGDDQVVTNGALVQLDGSRSTTEQAGTLSYDWQFDVVPDGSSAVLANERSASPSFMTDVSGEYVVQLVVSDGMQTSSPDTVSILSLQNQSPTAEDILFDYEFEGPYTGDLSTAVSDAESEHENLTFEVTRGPFVCDEDGTNVTKDESGVIDEIDGLRFSLDPQGGAGHYCFFYEAIDPSEARSSEKQVTLSNVAG